MLMQITSDMTRTHNPRFSSLCPCPLVLIGNRSLKRTIYCYICLPALPIIV